MDERQFQALLHQTNHKPTLEPCQMKLNTLQHPLKVKGKFETIIRNQMCGKPSTFVIVKRRINSPSLLSKDTMNMQNVNYEMRYEPGKNEDDPMDFLSRHPLSETGEDETEDMIKSVRRQNQPSF